MTTIAPLLDLDTPFELTSDQITKFRRDGYIKIKDLLSAEVLEHYRQEITGLVKELSKDTIPMEQRGTYGKAFLQISNLWEHSAVVKEFVSGKRLARVAAELMGTKGVRMYHDQALYKEAGGGYTPWHVDQVYWPLSNENTVTAWIPLHAVPLGNGPLSFSVGSQRIMFGRDLTISDESERRIQEHLRLSDLPIDETPFDLGEVSFHYGFTFHRAGPNTLGHAREVMTIIYMDSEMRLAQPKNDAQKSDWKRWLPGAVIGEQIDTPLNPVLYEK
ncbi:MAG: phytanoyl-CoA dioxygenase family protein [Candidatus Methylacidiphilales bacterium]|nr:phytanoyl-CoA dioxygenase family protein [Candidatus Methylacidiphilales bacterium]